MITAGEFVELFGKDKPTKFVRHGVIVDDVGRPRVKLDGETTASVKRYPYLSSYTPLIGDRVVILSGTIFGKVI